jgi:serine/threonine protein kinase
MEDLRPSDPANIGPYRLVGRIGAGGMGVVYLAQDDAGTQVAIKLIRDELAQDPSFRSRFAREVRAGQRVGGMCTARYLAADLDSEHPYLVTEYVAGGNLLDFVHAHGPLEGERLVGLAVGLAEGLVAMGAAGVIHRDLKPSNVLMADHGPKIVDFGISHAADGTSLTQTGAVVGSPSWMAPEQAQGRECGPSVDVFSWGATVAFAATGRLPFGEGRPEAVVYRVVHEEPDLDGIDPRLAPHVKAALTKEPSARPSADDLLVGVIKTAMAGEPIPATSLDGATEVLERTWAQPPPVGPKPRRGRQIAMALAVVAIVGAFVAGALYVAHNDAKSPSQHAASASTTTVAPPTTRTTTASAGTPSSTAVEVFAAWTAGGVLAPGIHVSANLTGGSCREGSVADGADRNAWRCMSDSGIHDPCFAPAEESNVTQVACAQSPSSGVEMLTLVKSLPYGSTGTTGNTGSSLLPWFMQLANGDQCGFITGTASIAGGVVLNYGCQSGGASTPNTSTEPWTVQYLPNNSHVISDVAVTTAWN